MRKAIFGSLLAAMAIAAGGTASATMKPEFREDARCRGALDASYGAMLPDVRPGESDEAAIARYSKEQPKMGFFIGNLGKSVRWYRDRMLAGEATAVTGPESHALQQVEDAERKRLNNLFASVNKGVSFDDAFDQMLDTVEPCLKKAGLFYK